MVNRNIRLTIVIKEATINSSYTQPNEALTVHGNVQVLGQIKQPCDQRIKSQIVELDPRRQLDNVNKIKIVKYKYRQEYVDQLPEHQQTGTVSSIPEKMRSSCRIQKSDVSSEVRVTHLNISFRVRYLWLVHQSLTNKTF